MKILLSPGFGAGWSTWNSGKVARYMLTYQPIIDYLESGGLVNENHPLVIQLQKDCLEKLGEKHVCVLGACDLVVKNVDGPFRIEEHDGYESIEYKNDIEWIQG